MFNPIDFHVHAGCKYCKGILGIFKACPLYFNLTKEEKKSMKVDELMVYLDFILMVGSILPYIFGILSIVACVYFRTTRISILVGISGGSAVISKIFQKMVESPRPPRNPNLNLRILHSRELWTS